MAVSKKKTFRRNDASEEEYGRSRSGRPKARSALRLERIRPASTPLRSRDARAIAAVLVRDARLPPVFWGTGWVLRQIEDTCWLTITAEAQPFPRRLRPDHTGHPAYVLEEIGNYALRICPCTSLPQPGPRIPRGAVLQPTGVVCDRDSFLVTGSTSVISRASAIFSRIPAFLGIFPPEKLQY